MARKTESLIRLSPEAKKMLVDLSTSLGLSQSETVEKLIKDEAKCKI